jgi:hypothetical protein
MDKLAHEEDVSIEDKNNDSHAFSFMYRYFWVTRSRWGGPWE